MKSLKLNLGCGNKKIEEFVGVDKMKTNSTDIVHDLDKFPYPFKDNSVDEIILNNVLEHLENRIKVLEELYRICKNGAIIRIYVPYAKSDGAFVDPTHKQFFTDQSFKYFEEGYQFNYYSKARFKILKKEFREYENDDWKFKMRKFIPFRKLLRHFLFNMYDEIYFELEVLKKK